jgi:hypothetical protein
MQPGGWVVGHSKVLMKHEQSAALGAALAATHHAAAVLLQRHVRGWWQVLLSQPTPSTSYVWLCEYQLMVG